MCKHIILLIVFLLFDILVNGYELELCSNEKIPNRICKMKSNYDKAKIPNHEFGLNCAFKVYDIDDIDEVEHSIKIYVKVKFTWFDPRLYHSNWTKKE